MVSNYPAYFQSTPRARVKSSSTSTLCSPSSLLENNFALWTENFSVRIFTFPPQPSAGVSPMGSSPLQRPDTFHNQVRWGLNNLITLHPNEYSLPNGKSETKPEKKYFQTQEANHWGFGRQRRQTRWSMRRASVFSFWHSTNFHRVTLHTDYWSHLLWHNCHTKPCARFHQLPWDFQVTYINTVLRPRWQQIIQINWEA